MVNSASVPPPSVVRLQLQLLLRPAPPLRLPKLRTVYEEALITTFVLFDHEYASTILMILQLLAIIVLNIYTHCLLKYKLHDMVINKTHK